MKAGTATAGGYGRWNQRVPYDMYYVEAGTTLNNRSETNYVSLENLVTIEYTHCIPSKE